MALTTTNDNLGSPVPGTQTIASLGNGGTGSNLSATGGANNFVKQSSVGAPLTVAPLVAGDVPDVSLTANVLLATSVLKERGRTTPVGEWTAYTPTLAASAGTFGGGVVIVAKYVVVGKAMTVAVYLYQESVSATPASLSVSIPAGFAINGIAGTVGSATDNGTFGLCSVQVNSAASTTNIMVYKNNRGGGSWATSATNTDLTFEITFEVA